MQKATRCFVADNRRLGRARPSGFESLNYDEAENLTIRARYQMGTTEGVAMQPRESPAQWFLVSTIGIFVGSLAYFTTFKQTAKVPWPTQGARRETAQTVKMLQKVAEAGPPPRWLAAIIGGSTSSPRFRATAAAAATAGGTVRHVPAAMPSQYKSLADMVLDLFGVAERRVMRLSPHEIGLLISHKRALKVIALSEFAWGAVLEDDACLHEAVRPEHAGRLLAAAFAAADRRRPQPPLLYLGSCQPRCDSTVRDVGLPMALLHGGRCHAYCTHAYALSRQHASTFFADVFGCQNGSSSSCGEECEFLPCFMDWAMTRYFKRSGSAWIVGGGLHGQWVPNHRGLFIQNRSAALGNAVSGGTGLAKRFRWANDSAHVQEQHCERGLQVSAAGSTPEDRIDLVLQAAREQQFGDELLNDVRDALLGKKNASLGRPDPTNATPLRTAVITIQWSGRLGNLLFELAMLAGMVKRLKATVANVEAVTFGLPDVEGVPVKELFEQFSLGELVRQADDEKGSFDGAYAAELKACSACKIRVEERYANAYDAKLVNRLTKWVTSPPHGCTLGLIELKGYFQSFLYFDKPASRLLRATLSAQAAATPARREAEAVLARIRRSMRTIANGSGYKLIGVQVRLGDKAREGHYSSIYAPISWEYYRTAMRELSRKFMGAGASGVAFVVTAGGSMGSNSADVADARQNLAGHGRIFFSSSESPYVDLAVLRRCDALVVGPSTFGWWAAYLANLPDGYVFAPRQLFNPKLPRSHTLVKGYKSADYYPPGWRLLGNDTHDDKSPPTRVWRRRRPAIVDIAFSILGKGDTWAEANRTSSY